MPATPSDLDAAKAKRRPLALAVRHRQLRVDRGRLGELVRLLDAHAAVFRGGCPPGELSLAFVTDPELALLHDEFLQDPSPTDVMTFPAPAGIGAAGEVCISADAARRQAGSSTRAFSRELSLYVVHGWLHLAGFDDRTPAQRRLMRAAERRAFRLLDQHAPQALAAFSLKPQGTR